jgi:hypothetical protein
MFLCVRYLFSLSTYLLNQLELVNEEQIQGIGFKRIVTSNCIQKDFLVAMYLSEVTPIQ